MKASALRFKRATKALQVFQGMERRLIGIPEIRGLLEASQSEPLGRVDLDRQFCSGFDFILKDALVARRIQEQDAVEPAKLTIDAFPGLDGLDPIDGSAVALLKPAGDFRTALRYQFGQ